MIFEMMANISAANGSINDSNDSDDELREFFSKFGMAEGIVGMVCNTLAWLVILRTKNLHNMTNYLLAYLAVIDCFSCFFTVFSYATYKILVPPTFMARELFCRLIDSKFSQTVTASVSSYTLCLVTYERYIGIVHALHYQQMISRKKVTAIVLTTWMFSLLLSSIRLFAVSPSEENNSQCYHNPFELNLVFIGDCLFCLFSYLLPILFMSWAYYKIQADLKRNAHQLQQQNVQAAGNELLRARQKVVNMLMVVMAAMIVFWSPLVFQVILRFWRCCNFETDSKLSSSFILLYYMNSVINPIIYVFKYKKFRKGLQDMICCCIGRAPRPNPVGVAVAMDEHNA